MTVPFTEPIAVSDIFTSGMGRVETLAGGNMRFTFYVDQTNAFDGEKERAIVLKLIITADAARDVVLTVLKALKCPPACVSHIPDLRRH